MVRHCCAHLPGYVGMWGCPTWKKCGTSRALTQCTRGSPSRPGLGNRQSDRACHAHAGQPRPNGKGKEAHAHQTTLSQLCSGHGEPKHRATAHTHNQAAPPRTHSYWPDGPPGSAHTHPDYNRPAETIRHRVCTEATFSRPGEMAISSNSQEQMLKVKQNGETEKYAPN